MATITVRQVRTTFSSSGAIIGYQNFFFDSVVSTAANGQAAAYGFWGTLLPRITSGITVTVAPDQNIISVSTGNIVALETGTFTAGRAGSNTGEGLPGQVQGLVALRTGTYVNGRRLQGRVFIPGATEQDSQGNPTAAYVTALQNAGSGLVAAPETTPVIYSRKNLTAAPVVATIGENLWATLRSRSARG